LQIGRAIQPLSAPAKRDLVSSSLRNSKNVLRKLATKDFDSRRENLIITFAKEDKADPKSAMQRLKKKLGMTPSQRTGVVAESVFDPKSYHLAQGESFELTVGRYVFRVEVKEHTSGRTHLTAMTLKGERKEQHTFLGAKTPGKAAKKKRVAAKASPTSDIAEAAE
jgi:lipopolysaccharide export LptBFGC system permease protein LptF